MTKSILDRELNVVLLIGGMPWGPKEVTTPKVIEFLGVRAHLRTIKTNSNSKKAPSAEPDNFQVRDDISQARSISGGWGGLAHWGWPTRGPHPNLPPAGGRDFCAGWGGWRVCPLRMAYPGAPILTFPRRGEGTFARGGGVGGFAQLGMAYPGGPILTFPQRGKGLLSGGWEWEGWVGLVGTGTDGLVWGGPSTRLRTGPSTRLRMNGKRAPLVGAPSFGAGVSGSGLWVGALAFLGSAAHYVDACGGYYGHYGYYQGYDG